MTSTGIGSHKAQEDGRAEGPPTARYQDLRNVAIASILEVTSDFLVTKDVDKLLLRIVKNVSETFGLRTASIGIRDKETGLFVIRAAHGYSPEVTEQIMQIKYDMDTMTRQLKPEFKIGKNIYYVPAGSYEIESDEDMLFVVHPERIDHARRFPNEWHELDFVDFLMYEKDGSLLGYLEIDEPDDHKVPDDEKLKAIEVFSDLAAIAIQNAELYQQLDLDRKNIELLIDLIAHDVNNYAQAVSGFVELAMSRKGIPEPSRKSMGKALDQVWNLNKLITNVKLYGRVEEEGGRDLRPMDIVKVVHEAFASAVPLSPSKRVTLVLEDENPKLSLMNNLAKDVFLNLFTNAIKFDERDDVIIEVTIDEVKEGKRPMWCVSVADNGPGVEDGLKEIIFDRFIQGTGTAKGSSGLGLHIAKTLVGHYKGKIWVEDRVKGDKSKGSVFKVTLPKHSQRT